MSDKPATDTLYDFAIKTLDGVRSSAERQERKIQITIAAITLLTGATLISTPNNVSTGCWILVFAILQAQILLTSVVCLFFCVRALMLKQYPYTDNLKQLNEKYFNKNDVELKQQLTSNLTDVVQKHQVTFEGKAKSLKIAVNYVLPILAAFIVSFGILRLVYFVTEGSTSKGMIMETEQQNQQDQQGSNSNQNGGNTSDQGGPPPVDTSLNTLRTEGLKPDSLSTKDILNENKTKGK